LVDVEEGDLLNKPPIKTMLFLTFQFKRRLESKLHPKK